MTCPEQTRTHFQLGSRRIRYSKNIKYQYSPNLSDPENTHHKTNEKLERVDLLRSNKTRAEPENQSDHPESHTLRSGKQQGTGQRSPVGRIKRPFKTLAVYSATVFLAGQRCNGPDGSCSFTRQLS